MTWPARPAPVPGDASDTGRRGVALRDSRTSWNPAPVRTRGLRAAPPRARGADPASGPSHRPPGVQLHRSAALAASRPLLVFRPGGTWASAGLQGRADSSSVWRGRNCPWSPAVCSPNLTLCPGSLYPCAAGPRACLKTTPVCQARASCPLPVLSSRNPLLKTHRKGELWAKEGFSV